MCEFCDKIYEDEEEFDSASKKEWADGSILLGGIMKDDLGIGVDIICYKHPEDEDNSYPLLPFITYCPYCGKEFELDEEELTLFKKLKRMIRRFFLRFRGRRKSKMAGLTPDVAKALKSTRDLIQSSKKDCSDYTDIVKDEADENNDACFDIADLADENSLCIEDLAEMISDLEERVAALEEA